MKKLLGILLVGILSFVSVACSSNSKTINSDTKATETAKVEETMNPNQAVIEKNMDKLQKYLDAEYLDADDLIAMEKECPDVNYGGFLGEYRKFPENSDENLHLRLAGNYNSYKVSSQFFSLGIFDISLSEEQPVKVKR